MFLIEYNDEQKKNNELICDIDTDDLDELSEDEIVENVEDLQAEDNKKVGHTHMKSISKSMRELG